MATTYWVSSAAKGGNDGTTFEDAYGSLASAIGDIAGKGDIVNVIADGDHTWPTTEIDIPSGASGTKGTSFVDYGALIQGVSDAAETPALASIVAGGGDAVHRFIRVVADTGYVIVRNLEFDATATTAHASLYTVGRLRDTGSPDPGPLRFEGCSFLGAGTGAVPSGNRQICDIDATGPPAGIEVFQIVDCYIQNVATILTDAGAASDKTITGCLIYHDSASTPVAIHAQSAGGSSIGELIITGNTIYHTVGSNDVGDVLIYNVTNPADAGVVTVQDNLVFIETSFGSPGVVFFSDTVDGAGTTVTDTIDYNVLLGGPNVAVGDVTAWYVGMWDRSAVANDQYAYDVAEATVFTDTAVTYPWDPLGNGATITVLKDLRPVAYTTASSTGGVIGALPAGQTDYSIVMGSDSLAPEIGDTVQLSATLTNTGTDATVITATVAIPSGLTYSSDTPGQGTYSSTTGLWTIGSVVDAASVVLTINVTVDTDQGGNNIVFTGSVTSGNPDVANDPDATNNTNSITLTVVDNTSTTDPDQPGTAPFIDVLPLIQDDLKAELNTSLRLESNRELESYIRTDYEDQPWSEHSSRTIVVGTSTTVEVNLGGIARGEFLFLKSTSPVSVSAVKGDTPRYWDSVRHVTVGGGDFEKLHVKNTSTTTDATVTTGAMD